MKNYPIDYQFNHEYLDVVKENSSSARLLYLTRAHPYRPLFGGEIAYSRGVIEALGRCCKLTVLAASNGAVAVGEHEIDGIRWIIVPRSRRLPALSLLTLQPNMAWRNATTGYHDALAKLLNEPWDGVVVDHFASVHAMPVVAAWRNAGADRRILYLSHEHERTARSEKYASYGRNPFKQAIMAIDSWKIGRWEDRTLRDADIVSLINPGERYLFERWVPGGTYLETPPGYAGPRVEKRRIDASVPRRVALLGGRGPVHKRNILVEWLDACAQAFADAGIDLDVIGDIDASLRASLQRRHPRVIFSGFVDDLSAHLQTARLGVVPDTIGRGVKVRLPSYIFARVPMLGLAGAIDGIPVRAGVDFLEAPDLRGLAHLCADVIEDFATLNRLQESAYASCDRWFDWDVRGVGIRDALVGRHPAEADAKRRHPLAVS